MAFDRINVFGAPNYGKLKGTEGIVFHTPENNDPSIEAAVATARWQASTGNTSGGSYHGILGHDDSIGPMSDGESWVLVQTVPFSDIAGSISTNRDPKIWQPGRFPRLKELLSDAAYADPNAYLHALCLGGKAAWWTQKLGTAAGLAEVRGALVALAVWVRRLEVQYGYDAFLNLHRQWQTNRTDPDGLNFADLVLDEYRARFFPQPEPVPSPVTYTQEQLDAAITAATADLTERNRRLSLRLAAKDSHIALAEASLVAAKEA